VYAGLATPGRPLHLWQPGTSAGAGGFTGAPDAAETYAWVAEVERPLLAVVDVGDAESAQRVVRALRAVRADVPVLAVAESPPATDRPVAGAPTWVRPAELLRYGVERELRRLYVRGRVERLRSFAAGAEVLPILIHEDPDPDAIASALALRVVLRRRPATAPIVTLGKETMRPENRRMLELLGLQVTRVTRRELAGFPRLLAADFQPPRLHREHPGLGVVDHHPRRPGLAAVLEDIRPEYGAVSTIVTEYLRVDDEARIGRRLASALLYGIKTDTDVLTRGASAADVEAYAFLQARVDRELLYRIEWPSYDAEAARAIGRALAGLRADGSVVVAHLGALDPAHAHIIADVADFCLEVEGACWVAVGAVIEDELNLAIRHIGDGPGAGELARAIAAGVGSGGGHPAMARVILPQRAVREHLDRGEMNEPDALLDLVRAGLGSLR